MNYQVTEKLRVALAVAFNDGGYGSFQVPVVLRFSRMA